MKHWSNIWETGYANQIVQEPYCFNFQNYFIKFLSIFFSLQPIFKKIILNN